MGHKRVMRLRPDTLAMTVVLALMTALGPLSTDMYLPSLPDMAVLLDARVTQIQFTLSVFLVGFAIGQILYGPISDRYGRRPLLLASFAVFSLASAACALATSVEPLIAARFVQALGAAGGVVVARAIVRDLYEASRAGQELALMGTIMGLVPLFAPALGALLHEWFGWRSNFVAMAAMGLAGLALIRVAMPETLKAEHVRAASARAILTSFRVLIGQPIYRLYLAFACMAYGGLFSFISASSFVLQDVYGLTPRGFGLSFAVVVLGYIGGTLAGRRLTRTRGIDPTIGFGAVMLAAGGLSALVLTEMAAPNSGLWRLVVPAAIYFCGVGLVLPQSMAGALTPFPERAGAASSLLGFTQMSFGALVGIVVAANLGDSARTLAVALAIMGAGAAVTFIASRKLRRASVAT